MCERGSLSHLAATPSESAAAHARHLGGEDPQSRPKAAPEIGILRLTDVKKGAAEEDAAPTAAIATLRAGDAVVFDASVLHFGGANTVADNERVVLYFGVARDGEAAVYDGGVKIRSAMQSDARRPVPLYECYADV